MEVKQALFAGAEDPEGGFGVIGCMGFIGLPIEIQNPILGSYSLGIATLRHQ
ncbi:hypothetical protein [Polynucleobacter brandtiae]|uniref:hypothetical protein n=1 Tax=Polynucleobacter brandtiae TaxID=1938816 RepID=UPI0012FDDA53|nr:hypothetical protein [Polynucleobacter brandtiae]